MELIIDENGSRLWTYKNYSPNLYDDLVPIFTHEKPPIVVYGKPAVQNRNIGFYSDESVGYAYSGQIMKSRPLYDAPILEELLKAVNVSLGTTFNGVLVNKYPDGTSYIGAHSDDESALDKKTKMVAAISYGAVRTFRIRDKKSKKIVVDIPHEACMLIVMEGQFQKHYTHEIPKQSKITSERISVTFRHHTAEAK